MNINCTLGCLYQKDGKCRLETIPSCPGAAKQNKNTDCAYFLDKTAASEKKR